MSFDPRNILVIDFGQLGDVIMSLPALRAIREHFPQARITVAVGKPGAEVIELSRCADATLAVDRVALRDGFKPWSVLRILRIVQDVRHKRFDFVIDLHSLSETNLLGFLSGAPRRLYSRRPRSLDFLANFNPRPPMEEDHRQRHLIDRYLASAEQGRIAPLICLNKADLVDPVLVQPIIGMYCQLGIPTLLTSATKGIGMERLRQWLVGRQTVFSGQSGVGKSSLLNTLQPDLSLRVREVSEASEKGRHTTTTAELIPTTSNGPAFA